MRVYTIGHGRRPVEELVGCLLEAGARTLVDVRRFPGASPAETALSDVDMSGLGSPTSSPLRS